MLFDCMSKKNPIDCQNWHVITKTHGGVVSILKNLTLRDALSVRAKLNQEIPSGIVMPINTLMVLTEIIGPEEWDGCEKAMKHQWVLEHVVADGDIIHENKGRSYTIKCCILCNFSDSSSFKYDT